MTRFLSFVALALIAAASVARADCRGVNLLETMPAEERRALLAAADAVPYPRGNLWRATRGEEEVLLLGTYHLDDPRHAAVLTRVAPMVEAAAVVLVEAGPEEEAALMADLKRDPSLMVMTEGPTLREAMPEAEWQMLAEAMRVRGLPPFMVSKFRPWYVSMLLALPACGMDGATGAGKGGLDGMIIAKAQASGVPVRALEPHDTVFKQFGAMSFEDQLGMITSALALEPMSEDYAVTLADAYFDGEARLIWELTRRMSLQVPGVPPEKVEADFAQMEQRLMTDRNTAWIPVIEAAAKEGRVVAAFGALHLSGETGVLKLLEEAGWTLERVPM